MGVWGVPCAPITGVNQTPFDFLFGLSRDFIEWMVLHHCDDSTSQLMWQIQICMQISWVCTHTLTKLEWLVGQISMLVMAKGNGEHYQIKLHHGGNGTNGRMGQRLGSLNCGIKGRRMALRCRSKREIAGNGVGTWHVLCQECIQRSRMDGYFQHFRSTPIHGDVSPHADAKFKFWNATLDFVTFGTSAPIVGS